MPGVYYKSNMLTWQPFKDVVLCRVLKNGKEISSTQRNTFDVEKNSTTEYQVIAVDKNNVPSFASEPILITAEKNISIYQAEDFAIRSDSGYKGFTGAGFAEISTELNRTLPFAIDVKKVGFIALISGMLTVTGQRILKINVS